LAETKVEERLISGTGLLRYPPIESAVRYASVLVDVALRPQFPFYSNKYSPPRQRYATAVFLRDGYVLEERPIDYPKRRFDFVLDAPGQTLLAVKCAQRANLTFFTNLAAKFSPPPVVPSNNISAFPVLNLIWAEFQSVCDLTPQSKFVCS